MKKLALFAGILAAGVSSGVFAQTFHINFDGNKVTKELNLQKNDVVMLDTSVPIGYRFQVDAMSYDQNATNFKFRASVVGVVPQRNGFFTDTIYAGANPGWVSYIFVGDAPTNAVFSVH